MSSKKAIETARALRQTSTNTEKLLWKKLRNRQFHGKKFLRQHPFSFNYGRLERFFITDFYCAEYNLVIELDGAIHNERQEFDESRTCILNNLGLNVIRFRNEEIEEDIQSVMKKIRGKLNS